MHMCPVALAALPHPSSNSSLPSFWNLPLPHCVWSWWRGILEFCLPLGKPKGQLQLPTSPGSHWGTRTCLDLSSGSAHLLKVTRNVSQASGLPATESSLASLEQAGIYSMEGEKDHRPSGKNGRWAAESQPSHNCDPS